MRSITKSPPFGGFLIKNVIANLTVYTGIMFDVLTVLGVSDSLLLGFFTVIACAVAYFRTPSAVASILAFYPAFFFENALSGGFFTNIIVWINNYIVVSDFFVFYILSLVVLLTVFQNMSSFNFRGSLFDSILLALSFAILYILGFYTDGSLVHFFSSFGFTLSETFQQVFLLIPVGILFFISFT